MSDFKQALQQSVLSREAEAARTLILNLKDVIADDEGMAIDMIEAETGLLEAIDGALSRMGELESLCEAVELRVSKLSSRKARFEAQQERIKTSIALAMEMVGLQKMERPEATLSIRAVPASVVIVNESDIPSQFWKPQAPKLDRKLVLSALKDGTAVEGAKLSNGGQTISIRKV